MAGTTASEPTAADVEREASLRGISDWTIGQALGDLDLEEFFVAFCGRVAAAGIPIRRAHLAVSAVHPMVGAISCRWWHDAVPEHFSHPRQSQPSPEWERSPLRSLTVDGLPERRFRLDDDAGPWRDYPLLAELRADGMTEYFALLTFFGSESKARERQDGMLVSWTTDRRGGFADHDLAALRRLQLRLAVGVKMAKREQTALNILTAYLGNDPGRRVLAGHIGRGEGESLHAVIWFCDMRGSTPLAERMAGSDFISLLNSYFECTAGAVLDHGGEVLRFIGDAVLAIFRADGPAGDSRAARLALSAARDAERRIAELNGRRRERGESPIEFGLALHVGEILLANVGVPERVDITVVGPAVNEAARLEGMTKTFDRRIIVSNAFSRLLPLDWERLGEAELRGVNRSRRVYAPPAER